jgi:hypothetical protein
MRFAAFELGVDVPERVQDITAHVVHGAEQVALA